MNQFSSLAVFEEMLHHVEPVVDLLHRLQRKQSPSSQQARAHRAYGAVNHVEQAFAVLAHWFHQLEVAHRKAVETHEFLLLDASERRDV